VAIPLPGPEELPAGPLRDFVEALHELYDGAGQPAARTISKYVLRLDASFETVSHETISAALRGVSTPPTWGKIKSIVTALARNSTVEHDERELLRRLNALWTAARHAPHPRSTGVPEATPPTTPPISTPPRESTPPLNPREAPTAIRPEELPRPPLRPVRPAADDAIIGPLPERNPWFTGRDTLLESMRNLLVGNPTSPLALHGVIGAGKTQLAVEYVAHHLFTYSLVWWIPAEDLAVAQKSLVALGQRLGMPVAGATDEVVAAQLGVAVRTVRRTVATLMNRLGARSRFQAGVKAAGRGWLLGRAS